MISRYAASFSSAISVTFGLLFTMQLLIDMGKNPITDDPAIEIPPYIFEPIIEEIFTDEPDIEPPPDVELPPPLTPIVDVVIDIIGPKIFSGDDRPRIDIPIKHTSMPSGELIAVVQVAPVYPRRAQARGIEGYAITEFSVSELGIVENARVIESSNSLFNTAALNAIGKFRFKPRVVDGSPVIAHGIQRMFSFELED